MCAAQSALRRSAYFDRRHVARRGSRTHRARSHGAGGHGRRTTRVRRDHDRNRPGPSQGSDADSRGYILDGFPRTIEQAVALADITTELGKPIDVVLDLNVPREIVLDRISARRVCRDCGTNYTASAGPDPTPWICDVCGGDVMQRDDDTPESVNRRLDLYEEQTFPLLKHYGGMGQLAVVNGVGHPDAVFDRLVKAVETNRS